MPSPTGRIQSAHPWHIVFVLDDSYSMSGQAASDLNAAIQAMIDELELISQGTKPYFKISVISFGSNSTILCEAVNEQNVPVNLITSFAGSSGTTNAAAALNDACTVLQRNPGQLTDFDPFIFFMSDGAPDNESAALTVGSQLKNLSIAAGKPTLVTIGLGSHVNNHFMETLATNKELYKHLQNSRDITKFLPAIGTVATATGGGAAGMQNAIMNI